MKRLALILALVVTASADVVTFSDRSFWNGAAGSVTNTSFNSLTPTGGSGLIFLGYTPPPVTLGDASYVATSVGVDEDGEAFINSFVFLITPTYAGGVLSPGGLTTLMSASEYSYGISGYSGGLQVNFGSGHTAVGFNLDTFFVGAPYTIRLSTGETFTIQANGDSSIFFGFVSDAPITGLYITTYTDSGSFGLGDVSYSNAGAPVPEPGTMVLVGSGLLAALRRMRK